MRFDDLQGYHKHIADTYNERSGNHDNSEWHRKTALKLINSLPPRAGDSVLDIGTGTGTIAFRAASLVGSDGRVVGVDLSKGMLAEAKKKLIASGRDNLDFKQTDAEHLEFTENTFDRMYCASAFFCIIEPLATLRHWFNLLKPNGSLGFHALPETSYFWVSVARDVLSKHGFPYLLNTPTGSMDKTHRLLKEAGFKDIDIREEKDGYYLPLDKAKESWITVDDFAPGQHPHPVKNVPPDVMTQCKREYLARIEDLNTDKGVWNDVTMYYIYAHK
jgi:ubiquinone/menaquinone biosynthesis C-methylase UbiE